MRYPKLMAACASWFAIPAKDELRLAAGDPPRRFRNCLSTAGHSNGAMLLRYVGAAEYPPVRTSVRPLAELLQETGEGLP